ncbi:MAG: radical SAM protein [Sediminibacterium sp.]|nr:radical SAM protein [Sediminibacterium sp.]
MPLQQSPYILYSDGEGNIYEDTSLYVVGRAGWDAMPIDPADWIELPEGGNLYELPGRRGIGLDVETGEMRLCDKGWAVAAFIPPAHTGLYIAAYETEAEAPTLPLFCYTAAGWLDNKTYVPAVRIEQDIRQECAGYDDEKIASGTEVLLANYPHNRLVKHLMENCCMTYNCPAARNFSMSRWECPVPTSPACNANCIGCISFQPSDETIVSTQDRLTFKPTAEEIVEFTVPHLKNAPFPLRPNNYQFEDIIESLKVMRSYGGWASINYFVFPGMTDSVEEYEALRKLILDTDLTMIQWRNFNIDPDWYMGKIGVNETGEMLGVKQLMSLIAEEFPKVKFGYFNPPIERIKGNYEMDFAGGRP